MLRHGCSAKASRGGDFGGTTGGSATGGTGSGAGGGNFGIADASAGPAIELPPEKEVEKAFLAPVATERYVVGQSQDGARRADRFADLPSANGRRRRLTHVHQRHPGAGDRAIVLNVLSNDATLLTREASGISQKTFQVAERANAWAISSDAHWAIAWTDVTQVKNPDKIDGFQTISIIDLTDPNAPAAAVRRTVGFRPSSISFADTPPRAFAVTEDGISIVDLGGAPR